jgi:magnesium transporter
MVVLPKNPRIPDMPAITGNFRFLYFSELFKRPVCAGKIRDRIGKVTDLVFRLSEPYPEAAGIFMEFGWGKPTQFIPWDRVVKIEDDAVFVRPPEGAVSYAPFVDQPGWILVDKHLMGRTVLDMDGRRTEVVNDVHMLESRGRFLIVHVDISFNGFLRKWGLRKKAWNSDKFVSWKYVQPLSVEDAVATDKVSLSITRSQIAELPGEDLADALEELSGDEQEALFSALDDEKAAETLAEAEPRTQRQLIADLRQERAKTILTELSVPQLADLFSVLPHDDMTELMTLLPKDQAERVGDILSEREVTAGALVSHDYVAYPPEARVGETLDSLRRSGRERESLSYLYVVSGRGKEVLGVVDLRELVLAADHVTLGEIMASPVVSAEEDDTREDLTDLFAKYHYRMVPVVDAQDRMQGVIRYKDVMKGIVTRPRA